MRVVAGTYSPVLFAARGLHRLLGRLPAVVNGSSDVPSKFDLSDARHVSRQGKAAFRSVASFPSRAVFAAATGRRRRILADDDSRRPAIPQPRLDGLRRGKRRRRSALAGSWPSSLANEQLSHRAGGRQPSAAAAPPRISAFPWPTASAKCFASRPTFGTSSTKPTTKTCGLRPRASGTI